MELIFSGCPEAGLFTREVRESLAGVLAKNCDWPAEPGFVSASVDGRFWWDTMWTRDAGVFLREMAYWDCLDHGVETARCLFRHAQPNEQGYRMFPMFFHAGEPAAGSELDGTAAILIGAVLLCERLPRAHPAQQEIWSCLSEPMSPARGLLAALADAPLVAGSGEFGGGCGIEGEFFNVVQNNLVRLALLAVARLATVQGDAALAAHCSAAAQSVLDGMLSHLRYPDGSWMWCRRTPDSAIDWDILDHEINAGFGGLNGVLAMASDVLGFLPDHPDETWIQASVRTFLSLLSRPSRLQQFARHGLWTQFDRYLQGYLTGPSYGHGYAIQCMQWMDWPDLYTPAINWLARATHELLPGQTLHRDSDYWFYERYYSPDAVGQIALEEGCGALNLVCVMEPLKIARLILGLDDHDPNHIRLIPRLPLGWTRAEARGVPVLTPQGVARVDVEMEADHLGAVRHVRLRADQPLPQLSARLGTALRPEWKHQALQTTLTLELSQGNT